MLPPKVRSDALRGAIPRANNLPIANKEENMFRCGLTPPIPDSRVGGESVLIYLLFFLLFSSLKLPPWSICLCTSPSFKAPGMDLLVRGTVYGVQTSYTRALEPIIIAVLDCVGARCTNSNI